MMRYLQNREVRLHLIPAVLLEDLGGDLPLPGGSCLTPFPLLLLLLLLRITRSSRPPHGLGLLRGRERTSEVNTNARRKRTEDTIPCELCDPVPWMYGVVGRLLAIILSTSHGVSRFLGRAGSRDVANCTRSKAALLLQCTTAVNVI